MGSGERAVGLGLTVALAAAVALGMTAPASASKDNAATLGRFSPAFSEPTIKGQRTSEDCIEQDDGHLECKPAAGSIAVLPDGRVLYWNALEGTENISNGIAMEYGSVSINDQTRVLDLRGAKPRWATPTPTDGGANPKGYETEPLIPGAASTEEHNDGALFCSDLIALSDGSILAVGGTAYYSDPGMDGAPFGVAELEGLRSTRLFDPRTNRWKQRASMKFGRWYPTAVTLGSGKIFVASGVQKLIKPIYPDRPQDSGTNVKQTETYDPARNKWRHNGDSADRSLPLYPRLHLLPNGQVFYNAAGQAFNPAGQSYDEPLWNLLAAYNPDDKTWTDLGLAGVGTTTPGFRGSSFSIMLPLVPDRKGRYRDAEFLSAGGTIGTTPGSYIAVPSSAITTVDLGDNEISVSARPTANLNNSRWYSTAIALPTGEVVAFSGADRDEVVAPGTGFAVSQAELFDPETETWSELASSPQQRTYHNSATLLPDGQVLVAGHAPIPTLYGAHGTLPGGFSTNEGRDPTFEIFSPPYLFRGSRPQIRSVPDRISYRDSFSISLDSASTDIDSVTLVRNPSLTHLIDGDQRTVRLRVISRSGNRIQVAAPPHGNVAPPGPYMLFVNKRHPDGAIPSISKQVFVTH